MTDYPELEKIKAASQDSQAQGEFLEWLTARYFLAELDSNDRLQPIHVSNEKLLAEFHGIDLAKAEAERRAILESL
jgi:hypothetical protein